MIRHLLKLVWNRKRANALLVVEIFFSFLVVFAVITLAAALVSRWSTPLGYSSKDVWVVRLDFPPEVQANEAQGAVEFASVDRLIREARMFPQVLAAAGALRPAYGNATSEGVWIVKGKRITMMRDEVTDDYAQAMSIRMLHGRWFRPEDDALGYEPVVIDSDLARAMFGTDNPVGETFANDSHDKDAPPQPASRVVGVIAPFRKSGELSDLHPQFVFRRISFAKPGKNLPPRNIVLKLRPGTTGDFEEALTKRLHAVAPDIPMRVLHMDAMRKLTLQIFMAPMLIAGVIALFLISMVALGLSGVLWQNVTRRTREIGLRRALGATSRSVNRQILAEVVLLATLAMIVGVVVVGQLPIIGLLTLVTPASFVVGLFGALATIYGLTLLCGLYPGWLAGRVQPAQALHYE